MQLLYRAIIIATIFGRIVAADLADLARLTTQCPPGYAPGTDQDQSPYCYTCGNPQLTDQDCPSCSGNCSSYSWLCNEFTGHYVEKSSGPCKNEVGDPNIFPSFTGWSNPVECHTGGERQEMTAQAYDTFGLIFGKTVSNMCGFLLGNCQTLHTRAKIYLMDSTDRGGGFNNLQDTITNDDFTMWSSLAVEISRLNSECS